MIEGGEKDGPASPCNILRDKVFYMQDGRLAAKGRLKRCGRSGEQVIYLGVYTRHTYPFSLVKLRDGCWDSVVLMMLFGDKIF